MNYVLKTKLIENFRVDLLVHERDVQKYSLNAFCED